MGQHTEGALWTKEGRGVLYASIDGQEVVLATCYLPSFVPGNGGAANARRLAACWNACEGFSTEDIETGRMLLAEMRHCGKGELTVLPTGPTLRDHFAAAIVGALVQSEGWPTAKVAPEFAERAYALADAMLVAREQGE